MAQENKELLLKDLCARLPYGVKVLNMAEGVNEVCELDSIMTSRKHKDKVFVSLTLPDDSVLTGIEMIKPYLRPMSSMTEEEKMEFHEILVKSQDCSYENNESATTILNDWYLSKGFDVRGLIPKGLAIAVTKENNPYKE